MEWTATHVHVHGKLHREGHPDTDAGLRYHKEQNLREGGGNGGSSRGGRGRMGGGVDAWDPTNPVCTVPTQERAPSNRHSHSHE